MSDRGVYLEEGSDEREEADALESSGIWQGLPDLWQTHVFQWRHSSSMRCFAS